MAARRAGVVQGSGGMRRHGVDRDAESPRRLTRAWRWLRGSGFYEDDLARPGPAEDPQAKERLATAALTQQAIWASKGW